MTLLGLLDGRPLSRAPLDHRLAALRTGPRASALPAPGSPEDRQLTRWVAQVLLTEELCAAEAAARGLDLDAVSTAHLDQRAAVELGSITAAAYEGSAAVRAVFEAVTAQVTVSPDEVTSYLAATTATTTERWHITTPDGEFEATPDTLPTALAALLRTTPTAIAGWTATRLPDHPTPDPTPDPTPHLLACARRLAFTRWLEHARATRLTLVPGLEHPGDPAQPDNHHRH
ncbi:DUF7158 domain-containing protein [Kitasatospora azatica]|uniref:DUF7158 domain-containing protein n=1 Tax=Kitasatospora azatica TaxID=58347 RepID=UPI00056456C2|nr:hypothetical protein [Kitasatospora azatica]